MNYMKQVAEMLSLDWDDEFYTSEEFDLVDARGRLIKNNVFISANGLQDREEYLDKYFTALLDGRYAIRKKIQIGDAYYCLSPETDRGYILVFHDGSNFDKNVINNNRGYRTEEEVKEVIKKLGWKVE